MTKQEFCLWLYFLKDYPIRFQRQKVIDNYIVDFYCHKALLVIEIDGSQHYSENGLVYDDYRTDILTKYNLVNVSESMIYVIFNVLNSGQLNIYQCTDKESECIINMLLKENYLYITQKKEYKWNRKQEELVVLLDYYYKLTKLD